MRNNNINNSLKKVSSGGNHEGHLTGDKIPSGGHGFYPKENISSMEGMQTLNEVLQSDNVNLKNKIDEYIQINNDLRNLFESTDIAILFLDMEKKIRRFTRQTTSVLNLVLSDIGRPFSDISSKLDYPAISDDVKEVLRTLVFIEKNIKSFNNRWYNVKILPYRTDDDRIDGLVITFSDITPAKHLERELKKANEALQIINIDLEKVNANLVKSENNYRSILKEKELLIREVHHRIKNNMSTIFSLLRLQAETQDNEFTKAALLDAASRVQSMMILYDKLYRTENKTEINLKEYFPAFIKEIVSIFKTKPSIKVITNLDDITLDIHMLSSIGIIMTELITNSMKYAFEDNSEGEISITAYSNKNHITILFQDTGPGLPEGVTLENSNGFGMLLIGTLVSQINGIVTIEKGRGAKYIIQFDIVQKNEDKNS